MKLLPFSTFLCITVSLFAGIAGQDESEPCPTQLQALTDCVAELDETGVDMAVACETCANGVVVGKFLGGEGENCERYVDEICNAVNDCDCTSSPCGDLIKDHQKCVDKVGFEATAGCPNDFVCSAAALGENFKSLSNC